MKSEENTLIKSRADHTLSSSPSHSALQTKTLRVMRIIARLNIGGPAIHTTLLTERLNASRFASMLVTGIEAEGEGNMLELMSERGLKTNLQPHIIPSLGREISAKNDLRTVRDVVRLMRRERPHIVHTHTAKAGFVGRFAARLARVPIVVHTFHGNIFKGYFPPNKTQLFVNIEKRLAHWTDRIIVLSEQQRREILGLGIGHDGQFRTIPLGLDLQPFLKSERFQGQLRAELGIPPQAPLIGIVARLVRIKAIPLFVEAAQKVIQTHPDAHFVIVGDGDERPALEAQVQTLGLGKSVHFLGFRADLPRIYQDLDCSVLCSLNEGLPVAVIEALAAARPVVATDVGGVGDLICPGKTGWLVPTQDCGALAAGICAALADPARAARFGQAGQAHVYPALDIERLVCDIEKLYEELAAAKKIRL